MAKKVKAVIKLHLEAGRASPAPPVGPALSQHGVNMMMFIKEYNERTAKQAGDIIPAEITVYADNSFSFILRGQPTSKLIKKELGLDKASSNPGIDNSGTITMAQLRSIAERKMADLNTDSVEAAVKVLAGTATSMGIEVESVESKESAQDE